MENLVEKLLLQAKVLRKGHFLLSSGLHSDTYYEKFRIFQKPKILEKLISISKEKLDKIDFEAILGPEKGGFFIAFEIGRQFEKIAIYAEKTDEGFKIRRDFVMSPDLRVLLTDDVLTTGGSVRKVLEAVIHQFIPVGIFVLIDRRTDEIPIKIGDKILPVLSLYKGKGDIFPPEKCPLCAQKISLEKLGGS